MTSLKPAREVVADLSQGSVEELARVRTEYPELSQRVCDLLFARIKRNERHRSNPWTQEAYDDLCRMLGSMGDVVDDFRNIAWVRNHPQLRELIALALMVVDPVMVLDQRVATGWITKEQFAARIRNERKKLQRAEKTRRFIP